MPRRCDSCKGSFDGVPLIPVAYEAGEKLLCLACAARQGMLTTQTQSREPTPEPGMEHG